MEHDLSNVPAGWYPSPENPNLVRFWDGQQWTHSTAAAAPPTPAPQPPAAPPSPAPQPPAPAPAPTFAAQPTPPAPPAPAYTAAAPPAPPRANQPLTTPQPTKVAPAKKWLIGGAVVAGVLIVGSIGAAIGSGGRTPETQQPAALTEPSPSATPTEETEAPPKESSTPAPPTTAAAKPPAEVNAVAFRAQANSHLDDMLKDLDDIVTTVEEDGFWRLISNVGELAFNQGQLEALDVPANVAKKWPAALVALDDAQDVLSEATSTEDDATILAAVKKMKAKVEAARVIADAAK